MTIGIYKIENIKNKKVYIGSSKNIEDRWKKHIRELNKNIHHSIKLQRSWNRTEEKDTFKFSVLEKCDKEVLFEREQYWIDFYSAFENGYNCCKLAGAVKYSYDDYKKDIKKQEKIEFYNKSMEVYDTLIQNQECIFIYKSNLQKFINKGYNVITYKKIV